MALSGSPRRLSWPGGLSTRLLLLTAVFVILAELMVLIPSLASYEDGWLTDRVRAAELASLAVEAAPAGVVSEQLARELLAGAGVIQVAMQTEGVRRLTLTAPRLIHTPELVDLRRWRPIAWAIRPFRALTYGGDELVFRVVAKPQFRNGDFVEILTPTARLRQDMIGYLLRLALASAFVFIVAGVLVYVSLSLFLVRPISRITRSMEQFRARPEDPAARLRLSGRRDEIGRAEFELSTMQDELRAALQSRARLASLGEAVAKINHDLRNILTGAQMASERLAASADPRVAKALPRLERALSRAIRLAQDVLDYGKSEEPTPQPRVLALGPAAEVAAEDAGLNKGVAELELAVPEGFEILADPDQLDRILVNLFKNAREAMEGAGRVGKVRLSAREYDAMAEIEIADTGPGLPERVKAKLFQPFAGSARQGGTGLGLAIARDLARAHGGDLYLTRSNSTGATFELRLPLAPKG